jgi:hypothetical protein
MLDYQALAYNAVSVAAATSKAASATLATLDVGAALKSARLKNGFNVQMAVVIAEKNAAGTITQKSVPILMDPGEFVLLDLESDEVGQRAPSGQLVLQVFAPGGAAPTDGTAAGYTNQFVADCLFTSQT